MWTPSRILRTLFHRRIAATDRLPASRAAITRPRRRADWPDAPAVPPVETIGHFPGTGPLPDETGPRSAIAGHRLLVLCDVENLTCSARDLGYKMSYKRLAALLREESEHCELHAFFSCEPGRLGRIEHFQRRGWEVHVRPIETIRTCNEFKRTTNSDNLILLSAGWLASRTDADLTVLASGDGTLVCDIARFLSFWCPTRPVVTLSLAGSTSLRLDAAYNPHLAANLTVGLDVLRPLGNRAGVRPRLRRVESHARRPVTRRNGRTYPWVSADRPSDGWTGERPCRFR